MQTSQYGHVSMIWIGGIAAICSACAALPLEPSPIAACIVGDACVVEGRLVATSGVGRIEDETGCVAVALPEYVTDDWNLRQVRASGEIYGAPDLEGLVKYKIRDREFDAEACYSGLAMYVAQIEGVPER
jgi:hypothetical protein